VKFDYLTDRERRETSADRRALLGSLNRCINGSADGSPSKRSGRVHGPVYRGKRCRECWETKLRSERRAA
jgi:hypothetical protein